MTSLGSLGGLIYDQTIYAYIQHNSTKIKNPKIDHLESKEI